MNGLSIVYNRDNEVPPHRANGRGLAGHWRSDMTERTCSVDGCERAHLARGFCNAHYKRWQKTGSPVLPLRATLDERFWAKVEKTEACWLWTGTTGKGYGMIRTGEGRKKVLAHRYAYELLVGPIPEGLELDHLCRTPRCVNPAHLEPVTHAENMRRAITNADHRRNQTHCIRGHEFTPENTITRPHGRRGCRACMNEAQRRYQQRQRTGEVA